jgi:hypothetical protein
MIPTARRPQTGSTTICPCGEDPRMEGCRAGRRMLIIRA